MTRNEKAVKVLVSLSVISAFTYVFYVLNEMVDNFAWDIVVPMALILLPRMDVFPDLSTTCHETLSMHSLRAYLSYLIGKAVKVLEFLFVIYASISVFTVLAKRLDSCAVAAAIVLPIALVLLPWMDGYLHLVTACHKNLSMPNIGAYLGYLKRKTTNFLVSVLVIGASTSVYSVLSERLDSCAVAAAMVLPVALVLLPQMDTSLDLSRKLKHQVDGVYQVNIENAGDVICNIVAPWAHSISRESHDLAAAACSNEFVLRNLYYSNANCDEVCYVIEQNFQQWLLENSLFDRQRKNLNLQFLQILRDVLRGIGYLHQVENRCHGNLSELNIVIVNGRGKITGMVKDVSKKYVDDYLSLAAIVRSCFHRERQTIPTELELLLTYISTTEPSRLLNIEYHPSFLSPLQRLCYRVIAFTFLRFGKKEMSFELELNEKLPKYHWKRNVGTFSMVLHRGPYDQSASSFMRFSRNIVVHFADIANQELGGKKLTAEEVDEELTGYWPEFMPILHQVLVDHGYLMFVHDAILK